jgi:putative sugar O-methyltransferase
MLEEPPEGNPPALYLRGRRISQDLGNAVLEFQSIARSGIDLSSTRTILELGAGYGRTAYVFQRLLPTARYIIADIPPALYLSQRYLSNQFSDRPILQYRPFTAFSEIETEFERARLCFLLPHQVELLPSKSVDLFINISSFHEMRPEQLRYYFHQVDRLAGGYVYLKQWKRTTIPFDEITLEQKDYPIPASWKPVFARECAVQTRFFEALYQAVR